MISVQNIEKRFGSLEVLKGISFDVRKGETIAIIGPSGSGKSTLLRCLNLLETPDGGSVHIGECSYTAPDITSAQKREIQRHTAMVFQNYNLFANKTAIENITLPLIRVKKIRPEKAISTAEVLLEKVGLHDRKDAYPRQLSGGQQQRVGIARALGLNPDVILFDEPTSALDPELVQGVLDVIRQIAEDKATSIVVTHEMRFASDVADRVLFMENGQIVEQGNARDVILHPQQERTKQFLAHYLDH